MVLAVTCLTGEARYTPVGGYLYYRIVDADIWFNMEVSTSPDWWVGATKPSESDRYDFGGILTHELGHVVFLNDLYSQCVGRHNSTDWYTMCGSYSGNNDSYWSRSLHADDKASANAIY